jgi:Protein kinase domain
MHAIRLRAGMTIGRYELVRCLGQGATGIVYEAVHLSLGRRVALKILHAPPTEGAPAKRAAERFLREGRMAAQVRHPHVVDVYDCGVEDGLLFLVMELVEGETLSQLLRREGRLPRPEPIRSGRQMRLGEMWRAPWGRPPAGDLVWASSGPFSAWWRYRQRWPWGTGARGRRRQGCRQAQGWSRLPTRPPPAVPSRWASPRR